jgi:hypothetical protein
MEPNETVSPAFSAPVVLDADTTYRVSSRRPADLKARALAAYFPPHEVKWLPKNVKNGRALGLAYITARAVMDRLDYVLGPDNWQDRYEELPSGSVRCRLMIRFEPEGEWVEKSDVGGRSEQPDEGDRDKAANSDALKRAAVKFGIGRYLYTLSATWGDYDERAKKFTHPPRLPDACVPTKYRPADPAKRDKVRGLLRSCLAAAKVPPADHNRAVSALLKDYGYTVENSDRVENRHVDAMLVRLGKWAEEIAKGNPNCPESPLYSPPAQPAPAPAQLPAKSETKSEPAKPQSGKLTKPANGAELLARLELKDDELAKAKKIQRGAIKVHVLAKGVGLGYSADVTNWQGTAIDSAMKWAGEFLAGLAEGATVEPQAADAPPFAVA